MSSTRLRPSCDDADSIAKQLLAAALRQDEPALLGLLNRVLLRTPGSDDGVRFLSEPEAARRLGISPRSLWSLANEGRIAFVRIGTSKRYDPTELDRFIAANTVKNALPSPDVGT